jgi:hypothetical protein
VIPLNYGGHFINSRNIIRGGSKKVYTLKLPRSLNGSTVVRRFSSSPGFKRGLKITDVGVTERVSDFLGGQIGVTEVLNGQIFTGAIDEICGNLN